MADGAGDLLRRAAALPYRRVLAFSLPRTRAQDGRRAGDIARCLHPEADLDDVARLLPVRLEFGVPAELVPLAQSAGAALGRTDYLRLAAKSLTDPTAILDADDDVLLQCLNEGKTKLPMLRQAARAARDRDDGTDFADLLPASAD
jgi:ATP-dependent DNA helicase